MYKLRHNIFYLVNIDHTYITIFTFSWYVFIKKTFIFHVTLI